MFPSPERRLWEADHIPGEGADFVVTEVTEMLAKVRAEASLLRCLDALLALKGTPFLATTKQTSRLRLQVTVQPSHLYLNSVILDK